jgi:hypothetical protein
MFGKAVKIRHCPATVSAPEGLLVVLTGTLRDSGQMPLGDLSWEGGSERRKSGDRSFGVTYLADVPRGTEDR